LQGQALLQAQQIALADKLAVFCTNFLGSRFSVAHAYPRRAFVAVRYAQRLGMVLIAIWRA